MKKTPATKCQYRVELLEPRLLLAADWAAGLAPSWDVDGDHSSPIGDLNDYLKTGEEKATSVTALPESLDLNALLALDFTQDDRTQDSQTNAPDTMSDTALRQELVIIDAGVEGYELLLADFEGRNGGDTYYDVHVLAADANGVQSLTAILTGYTDLDALHIVSHGDNGGVQLGDTRLDTNSIDAYAQLLSGWSTALGDEADLLVYGCDLAASGAGQNLIEQLGALTQADVAASDDATGLVELGGDWELEYTFGEIDSALAFSTQIQGNWSGLLASFTVNTLADTVDANPGDGLALDASGYTSLRAAIMEANAWAGADTITLGAGNYLLGISGDDNTGEAGDLDVTDELMISGAGFAVTTIDAQGIDRVLHAISDLLTITDVTLTGGVAVGAFPDGGALLVETGASATLERVVVTGNSAQDGGGLFSNGTLKLWDVTVTSNTADQNGGGMRLGHTADLYEVTVSDNRALTGAGAAITNGATATLTNVTISGNDAIASGGGLRIQGTASFINVTIADNMADGTGGGVAVTGGGASVTASNTIFADNTAVSTGNDFSGSVISDGSNIIKNNAGSSGFGASEIADPLLDLVLRNNGGITFTHALLAGSPAIDNLNSVVSTPSDQRGYQRIGAVDSGAFEFGTLANGTPTAINDNYATPVNMTLSVDAATGLLANDSDPEFDPLLVRILNGPLNGSLTLNPVALDGEFNLSAHIADETHPEWSPDGSQVVFHSNRDGNPEIYVANADGTGVTRLTTSSASDRFATWSPDGSQIAFSSDRAGTDDIWVMDADGTNPVRLTTGAAADGATDHDPHWAADGSLIVFVSNLATNFDIFTMNPDGTNLMWLTNTGSADIEPSVSADGTRIAWVSDRDGNPEIYVMNVDGSNVTRLTNNSADDLAPSWSPDGSKILFHSTRDGEAEIFVMDADGSNQTQLTFNSAIDEQPDWSADGSQIVFSTDRDGNFELYTVDILSDGAFSYTPNAGFTGIDSFTYEATDGTAQSGPATVTLKVDAISNTSGIDVTVTSATDSTTENTDLVFSVANGNAITVDDGTDNDPVLRTILGVGNGVLNLASITGLSSVIGDGTDTITVIGAESDINAALDGLTFSPTPGYSGTASLQIYTDTQADLLGFYNFTQSNPLGLDSSPAGGNDATPSGPGSLPDPNSIFDADRNSDVLVLDGVDDNLRIAGRFGTPTNVTIAAWVNVTTTNEQDVISLGSSVGLRLNDVNNGVGVTGFFNDGSGWNHTDSAQFIGGDGWHHVAFTLDDTSNTQVIYIDGVALGTTSYAAPISWTHLPDSTIGSHANSSSYWLGGMLDDVRIYDRALSVSEIQAIASDQFSDTEVISISVQIDNSAPVLSDENPGLTAINEDEFATGGDSVAAIVVDGSITDPDGAAVESIAITAVDDSNGAWQYSTDNGVSWNDIDDGALGVDHALLLDGTLVGVDTQRLRFVPDADFSGSAEFTFRAWDMNTGAADTYADTTGAGGTSPFSTDFDTASINVNPINDAPSFSTLGDQSVLEDSGPHTVAGFANALPGGGTDESGQTFTYTVSSDNPGLFLVGPAIDASGTLTYTLNPNINGTATVTVSVTDSGGTANGGVETSADQTFDIIIGAVNDAPSFSTLGDQNVLEDSGPHSVVGFANALPGGGADESGQTFTYTVNSDNPGLFLVGPAIDASGTLTYTLNANTNGTARVTVSVTDSGGTTNGGVNTSADQTFDIIIGAVNDAPSFSTLGDQSVLEDSGPHTVAGFANALPGGGTDESGQTFTYTVSSDNPGLFLVGPAIDASGTLTYTLNPNINGTATVTVSVTDSGGTANGGVETSADQTFDIDVGAVNDAPLSSTLGDQFVLENSDAHSVAGFASATPGGAADESGQNLSYVVVSNNPSLFSVDPKIDDSGTLTYTLNANINGTARVAVYVTDSGGTANGGSDTSATQYFDIIVGNVGDQPVLLVSTSGNVGTSDAPGLDAWGHSTVLGFGDPGFTLGPGIATSGVFTQAFELDAFGPDRNVNGLHYVSSSLTVGSGAAGTQFTLLPGDLLLSYQGGGGTYTGLTTSVTVDEKDVFVFRPQAPGDYSNGEFYYLLDNPLTGGIQGIALVESAAVTVGDGPSLSQGTFLLSQVGGSMHDNIYTYQAQTVGNGTTTSLVGGQVLTDGEDGGDLGFSDRLHGIHLIEENTTIGGVTFLAGDLLLSLDKDQLNPANGVGTTNQEVRETDIMRLRLSETQQGPNGRSIGEAVIVFEGTSVGLDSGNEDIDALTIIRGAPNVAPAATNLTQSHGFLEDASSVPLDDIVVSDANTSDTMTVRLVLADTAAGSLTYGSGNGETYNPGSGIWTVIGTLTQVNAALADVAFVPAFNSVVSTSVTTHVEDQSGNGPSDGLITLSATAVNDVPSFSTLGDQNVLEDAGPQTVAGFASALPGGGTDEAGQTFTYNVSSDNPGLFLVGPAIDASGTLTYTLNANINGTARLIVSVTDSGGTANGGVDTSTDQTFDIIIGAVNDVPSFTTAGDQNVLEDAGPQTVAGFASALPGGGTDEAGQTFTYNVSSDNPGLFLVGPAIDASGTLTYTLNANINGTARLIVSVTDSGGTANGGVDTSTDQTFDIIIGAVNDVPSFTTAGDQNVLEDAGPQTVAGFASALPGGGTDEAGQTFTYNVSSDNPGLFLVGPAIDASGTLTYTLNANINGTARLIVSVTDSGGTANGGVDTSTDQTFDIIIGAVNDVPTFSTLGDQNVLEDAGAQTVAGFATALPGGGTDEAGQTFTYNVSSDNPGLFLVGPAIDASGTLTYTLNANINGTARLIVSVTDSGGTTNGGVDTSADQTFDIIIGAVNDVPSFTTAGDQNVLEDAGAQTVAGFATALPGGGTDEAGQTFTYNVSSDNPGLFLVGPAIDASGTLTYTLNANINGTARLIVSVTDSGGTTNGGVDTSADQTFDIIIGTVNDVPSFSTLGDQNVLEDAGAQTVAGFATALPGGGTDEAAQTFTYTVSSNNPDLFLVAPAIDASGTLTYTVNPNFNGSATVTVSLSDSGGTANGGIADAADQSFEIVVAPIDDILTATNLTQTHLYLEDTGPVALHDILVNVGGAGGIVSATLTLSNTAAGHLSTDSGNGETYSATSGEWTIEGTVAQVNAALAAVVFVPVADNDVSTSVFTHVNNSAGQGPADGLITLTVTPVNDAPTGDDRLINLPGDSVYTLNMADFGFSDAVEGHTAAGVEIIYVPETFAILTNLGTPVAAGQFISAGDIAAGHLRVVSISTLEFTSFANLVFRVQDAGGTAAGGIDADPTPNILRFSINPTNEYSTEPVTLPFVEPQLSPGQPATPALSEPQIEATDVTENAPSETSDADATVAEESRATPAPASLQNPDAFEFNVINDIHAQTLHSNTKATVANNDDTAAVNDLATNTVKPISATPAPVITATTDDISLSLDQMRTAVDAQRADSQIILNSSVASVLGLSVGYVSWLLRGGALLSSVLSGMPVWKFVDPLPVFAHKRDDEDEEDADESLAAIVQNRSKQIESSTESAASPPPADPST